jgi:hypothetical protein
VAWVRPTASIMGRPAPSPAAVSATVATAAVCAPSAVVSGLGAQDWPKTSPMIERAWSQDPPQAAWQEQVGPQAQASPQ